VEENMKEKTVEERCGRGEEGGVREEEEEEEEKREEGEEVRGSRRGKERETREKERMGNKKKEERRRRRGRKGEKKKNEKKEREKKKTKEKEDAHYLDINSRRLAWRMTVFKRRHDCKNNARSQRYPVRSAAAQQSCWRSCCATRRCRTTVWRTCDPTEKKEKMEVKQEEKLSVHPNAGGNLFLRNIGNNLLGPGSVLRLDA
jgi:hypothetical protein